MLRAKQSRVSGAYRDAHAKLANGAEAIIAFRGVPAEGEAGWCSGGAERHTPGAVDLAKRKAADKKAASKKQKVTDKKAAPKRK